jgi:hypothetical protein
MHNTKEDKCLIVLQRKDIDFEMCCRDGYVSLSGYNREEKISFDKII